MLLISTCGATLWLSACLGRVLRNSVIMKLRVVWVDLVVCCVDLLWVLVTVLVAIVWSCLVLRC